jgi:hypothetical protein
MRPPSRATLLMLAVAVLVSGCARTDPARWVSPPTLPSLAPVALPATPAPPPTPTLAGTPSPTPNRTPALPSVIDHGPRIGNRVALTFDADMTPAMLERLANGQAQSYANLKVISILEEGSVSATFFITGLWAQRYPDVMRRLAANPHFEFGNHTWTHRAYTPNCYTLGQVPAGEMASEIHRTFAEIQPFGGHQTRYFRFPGLCYNPAALLAIAPENVTVIQGDVVSGDPGATRADPIVRAVLNHVQPGSIVVMHVTEDNAAMTDEALPPILAGLKEKGLQPVRLSELLAG